MSKYVDEIIAYECGELDVQGTLTLFKHLIESGLVNSLQGHYGRTAVDLVENGYLTINRDKGTVTINQERIG